MMGGEELAEEELELIRRRKLAEYQRAMADEQSRVQAREQIELQKQALLRQIFTPEARQRLANIRMVRPEFAEQLELQFIQLTQTGKIRNQITDEQLKAALARLQSQKKEIRIRRI